MIQPEQQITTIENASTDHTLHITNNRLIFIKTSSPKYVGVGLLGGAIFEAINQYQDKKAKKTQKQTQNLTVDEKLTQIKGSFAINIQDIKEIRLHACWNSEFSIQQNNNKVHLFYTDKTKIATLQQTLTKIPSLQNKITIL
jgi:hypothetical protein